MIFGLRLGTLVYPIEPNLKLLEGRRVFLLVLVRLSLTSSNVTLGVVLLGAGGSLFLSTSSMASNLLCVSKYNLLIFMRYCSSRMDICAAILSLIAWMAASVAFSWEEEVIRLTVAVS